MKLVNKFIMTTLFGGSALSNSIILKVIGTGCISGGSDAEASFEAKVPGITIPVVPGVPIPISLGNAGIKLEGVSKKNVGFYLTSKSGLTPFMTLYGIRKWSPLHLNGPNEMFTQLTAMYLRDQFTYGPETLDDKNTYMLQRHPFTRQILCLRAKVLFDNVYTISGLTKCYHILIE